MVYAVVEPRTHYLSNLLLNNRFLDCYISIFDSENPSENLNETEKFPETVLGLYYLENLFRLVSKPGSDKGSSRPSSHLSSSPLTVQNTDVCRVNSCPDTE